MLELNKIYTEDIEMAVARYFNYRTNLIVPNISWGMFLGHECDLFVLTKAGYGYEAEIKITKQDIKIDLQKKHKHNSNKIRKLYFAMPEYLEGNINLIPERAGILIIYKTRTYRNTGWYFHCRKTREAMINSKYKFTEQERYNLARLGSMRIWGLKRRIRDIAQERQQLKQGV